MRIFFIKVFGMLLVMVMAGIIGYATKWYVAPCIILMQLGQEIYQIGKKYE